MATYPNVHPEKCPYCGKPLALVTAKYEWDYAYQCTGCKRKYPFKNSQMPDIKAVYETEQYKSFARQQEMKKQEASKPVSSWTSSPYYIVKEFRDENAYGKPSTSATVFLQQYLNTHNITPDKIINIGTAYYGGVLVMTLTHV
jgi:hypothetical protein